MTEATARKMPALAILTFPSVELLHFDLAVKIMLEIQIPYPARTRHVMRTPLILYKRLKGLYKIRK
jgi:hypothetical protein